eukprot:GHVR01027202.1.p1 GENE.GHVR01027202.1~~GHVR01027202.1.p1  ORF type:complete len:146 (-),score=8.91 GHVR01027202.1:42-479(-)
MGTFLLMGSTALIDTGIMDDDLHVMCASTFFVFTLIAQLYNTILCWIIHQKTNKLSVTILWVKTFLVVVIFIQIYVSTAYGELNIFKKFGNMNDQYGNDVDKFIEWSLAYTILFGFFVMAQDLKQFIFVYEQKPTTSIQVSDATI